MAQPTRMLVPAGVSEPPGILNVSTLHSLLRGPIQARSHTHNANLDVCKPAIKPIPLIRPSSSELARVYGGEMSNEETIRNVSWRRKRAAIGKMDPLGVCRSLKKKSKQAHRQLRLEPMPRRQNPVPKTNLLTSHDQSNQMSHRIPGRTVEQISLMGASPSLNQPIQQEIQWVRAHFPILQLANTQCSLSLRLELFTTTVSINLSRGRQRLAFLQWRHVLAHQRAIELQQHAATRRIVACLHIALQDQVSNGFNTWIRYVRESQEDEKLAASRTISLWYLAVKQRILAAIEAENRIAALRIQWLAQACLNVTVIQSVYRRYRCMQRYHRARLALRAIQCFVRTHWHRRATIQEAQATAALKRHILREYHLFENSKHAYARKIQKCWQSFLSRRSDLILEQIHSIIDQVEFNDALSIVQRYFRGISTRRWIARWHINARCIQRCWRYFQRRKIAQNKRKLQQIKEQSAATCVQRVFRGYRTRRLHQQVMQLSSIPLYMRVNTMDNATRNRYASIIRISAATVIQVKWRRYTRHNSWLVKRHNAAVMIQRCIKYWHVRAQWQQLAKELFIQAYRRRVIAHDYIVQWWKRRQRNEHEGDISVGSTRPKSALADRLTQLLTAAVKIQRFVRFHQNRWHRVLCHVLIVSLPQYRVAANRIRRWWKRQLRYHQQETSQYAASLTRVINLHLDNRDVKDKQQRNIKRRRLVTRQEARKVQQREVIHRFLQQQQLERTHALKQYIATNTANIKLQTATAKPAIPFAVGTASPGYSTSSIESPINSSNSSYTSQWTTDNPAIVKYWSEEYQCHYLYHLETGESTWCND